MTLLQDTLALYNSGKLQDAYALATRELPALLAAPAQPQAPAKRKPPGQDLPMLLNIAAACAYALGRADEAERLWRTALEVQPQFAEAHSNLGLLWAGQGRLNEAEAAYREALAASPRDASIHDDFGLLLARLGRPAEAEQAHRKALSLQPGHIAARHHLGRLLQATGRPADAEQAYRHALKANPRLAEAHNDLAVLLEQLGRHAEAEAAYRKALAAKPGYVEAQGNLGNLLQKAGRVDEAEQAFRQALDTRPDYFPALYNLANLLAKTDRLEEAEEAYQQAQATSPDSADALCNLGIVLARQDRHREAEDAYRQALALNPGHADALTNLGNLLLAIDCFAEAETAYRQAIAADPAAAKAHVNLGFFLTATNRAEAAEAAYRQGLALDPGTVNARFNYSLLLLAEGRYREAWPFHEARQDPAQQTGAVEKPSLPFPQWQGEPLGGRAVLVWPEQGHGDAIQFCRLVGALKARGAAKTGLACAESLTALLQTLDGLDAIHPNDPAQIQGGYDYWTFPLSIPYHLDLGLEDIPAALPYLHADPERIARWQARLPAGRPRVGLVWQGNPAHANDARRSLPSLATLAPLWKVPGIHFVSLQKGGSGELEAAKPPKGQALAALGPEIQDFADTAAIIAQLDLVICVDTAAAHICGALGRPCWVLLPYILNDWRWLRGRTDSPWYPGALRLFRQGEAETWAGVVARVAEALQVWREAQQDGAPAPRKDWRAALGKVFGR